MFGEINSGDRDPEHLRHPSRGPTLGDVEVEDLELARVDLLAHQLQRAGEQPLLPFLIPFRSEVRD